MELPTYTANQAHHRASLLTNMKFLKKSVKEWGTYSWSDAARSEFERYNARIRRDLESLNGMAGIW